jgi:hypothetical protein
MESDNPDADPFWAPSSEDGDQGEVSPPPRVPDEEPEHPEQLDEPPSEPTFDTAVAHPIVTQPIPADDEAEVPSIDVPEDEPPPRAAPPAIDFASLQPIPQHVYTEEKLDAALNAFIRSRGKTFKRMPMDMRRPLFQHIARRRVEAIGRPDYAYGEKLVAAAEWLRRAMAADMAMADETGAVEAIEARLKEAKTGYSQARQECENRMKQLEQELSTREREIRDRHEQEYQEFSKGWSDPSKFHEWNKPSSQLLALRASERSLALAGDFGGAKALKKRADRLERKETEQAQQRVREAMELAFQQVLERHSKELEAHERLRHKITCQAQVMIDGELTPMKMAIKKLEELRDYKRVSRRRPQVSKSKLVARRSPEMTLHDDDPIVQTPRTRGRLADLRRTPNHSPLPLAAVEASPYIEKNRPRSKREPKPRRVADF